MHTIYHININAESSYCFQKLGTSCSLIYLDKIGCDPYMEMYKRPFCMCAASISHNEMTYSYLHIKSRIHVTHIYNKMATSFHLIFALRKFPHHDYAVTHINRGNYQYRLAFTPENSCQFANIIYVAYSLSPRLRQYCNNHKTKHKCHNLIKAISYMISV